MPYRYLSLLVALGLLVVASPLDARTWNISPDGSGDVPTIQAGIDSSSAGDTVLLEDGVYTGSGNRNLDFLGKAITVRSQGGNPEFCTLDVEFESDGCEIRGALFRSGEGPDTVFEGIKIINMQDFSFDVGNCIDGVGAAIVIENASPTLRRIAIENTDAKEGWGKVVTVTNGSPLFEDCILRDNHGEALTLQNTSATITGCVIEANSGGGSFGAALVLLGGSPTIESTAIRRNRGAGVSISDSSPSFAGCLIAENRANLTAGGIQVAGAGFLTITRTTIAGNRGAGGGGIVGEPVVGSMSQSILWANCVDGNGLDAFLGAGSNLTVDCSVVDPGNVTGPGSLIWGSGNVSEDPLFCEPRTCSDHFSVTGLYSLQLFSAARDAPGCGTLGALYDVCTVSLQPTSWGKIKASYR